MEGYYLGFKIVETQFGKGKLYIFETKDGNIGIWGKKQLNEDLPKVPVGTMMRITFKGMRKGKFRPLHVYEIEKDPTNTIDVLGSSVSLDESVDYSADEDSSEDYTSDISVETSASSAISNSALAADKAAVLAKLRNRGQ